MDHMELQQGQYLEKLTGIVERVTFHNSENGWSVLKCRHLKILIGSPPSSFTKPRSSPERV